MVKKKVAKKAKPPAREPATPKSVQPHAWRKMCKLASDALLALEAGDLKQVKNQLEALRAITTCADAVAALTVGRFLADLFRGADDSGSRQDFLNARSFK